VDYLRKSRAKRVGICIFVLSLVALSCTVTLTSCIKTVPITGRSQLNSQQDKVMHRAAARAYQDIMKDVVYATNPTQLALVQQVYFKLQEATEEYFIEIGKQDEYNEYQWGVELIEEPTPNAFCLPNGKIVIHTGILPFTANEDGLATLIGHEIAHALARHGAERTTEGQIANVIGEAASASIGPSIPTQTGASFSKMFTLGMQYGFIYPHSRLHESEADHMGLILMAMAGFNPEEAPRFWLRMASNPRPPEFLSTHPDPLNRMDQLEALVPTVDPIYKKAKLLGR